MLRHSSRKLMMAFLLIKWLIITKTCTVKKENSKAPQRGWMMDHFKDESGLNNPVKEEQERKQSKEDENW